MKNDLITRQEAIDTIGKVPTYDDGMVFEALSHAQRDVALLPSAQPGRKRGQWLDGYKRQTCSLCKGKGVKSWNYCPYCGADMRKVDDERPD